MISAQIKNSFTGIGEVEASVLSSTLELKICITEDSIRYFVSSVSHRQIIFFGDYTLHHVINTDELAQRLEKIFEKDEVLQIQFSKLLVGFDGKYSLVPDELSDLMTQAKQLVHRCRNTNIVFEEESRIIETVKRLFPSAEVLHLNSTFFQLLPEYLSDNPGKLFVNIAKNHLDVIRFDNQRKLQLMNRYEYKASSDFIYFVLLCCEELKIDREKTELVLMGELDAKSKIYELCYRYFKLINFIQNPLGIGFSKAFAEFPKHLHFNLYNLSA